jgi:ribosomal protein S18 acetylase RimI-like enzyme
MREVDVAGCGRSEANAAEVAEEMGGPDVRWGEGACIVRRGREAVAVALSFDGLAEDRGWDVDVFVRPTDPDRAAVTGCLIDAGLRAGQARWAGVDAGGLRPPIARSFCFANDDRARAVLERRGFAEARRYWRMRIEHSQGPGSPATPAGSGMPSGYQLRTASGPGEAASIHAVSNAAFADHFDSTPLPFERWLEFMTGPTSAPDQWTVVEHGGGIVGFAIGSNRYAEGDAGYVASLAVLREHRGRGLATQLLHARFADDARLGRRATLLHCDSENLTGATRIYERVGMRVDQEVVAFHRPLVHLVQRRDAGAEQSRAGRTD